jgi:hypothetical protein
MIHDYLQGVFVALGSGTVVVGWRWLEPVRAAIAKDFKLRMDLRRAVAIERGDRMFWPPRRP